jgi:nicotinamidase-related amidase
MITKIDNNTALILIDLQKGIISTETVHPIRDVIDNVNKLITEFRKRHLPIVIVNVDPTESPLLNMRVEVSNFPTDPDARQQALEAMKKSGFSDIIPQIASEPDDIFITKRTWNAFYETRLYEELKKRGVGSIVLTGIATSIGVEGTARAASEYGYNLSFATDAMTDRRMSAHEHSISYIFPRIGQVGTTSEIIESLSPE